MPRRNQQIYEPKRPYHIVSRAVEGRGIFETAQDCSRFLFQMYAANVGSPAPNLHRADMQKIASAILEGLSGESKELPQKYVVPEHAPLVEFFSFALARNHYHFGLVPTVRGGIPQYMQKLNVGFAKYFNLKHNRKGPLFETRFEAVPIKNPKQLEALVAHINVKNVLDVYKPNWQKKGFDDDDLAIGFLKEYPYSSYQDLFLQRKSSLISLSAKEELKGFLKPEFLKTKDSLSSFFSAFSKKEFDHMGYLLFD